MQSFPPVPPYAALYDENSAFVPPSPPPVIEGQYEMFGALYTTENVQPSLKDAGMQQLCSDDGSNEKEDLKKLAKSALVCFLETVRGMVLGENQDERVAALEVLFVNMHYIVNRHRPQQARDSLIAMMRDEIEVQRALAHEIDASCDEAEKLLQELAESGSKRQKV